MGPHYELYEKDQDKNNFTDGLNFLLGLQPSRMYNLFAKNSKDGKLGDRNGHETAIIRPRFDHYTATIQPLYGYDTASVVSDSLLIGYLQTLQKRSLAGQ